jgi:DNA-binding phage protein
MRRSDRFNERFSQEMQNPAFASEYILLLLNDQDEPMSVEEALRYVIFQMGTTEFAEMVGMRVQTIDKFLKGERHPKRETLDKFLKPFGLKTVMTAKPDDQGEVA